MGYFTKTLRPTLPVATMINSNASDLAFSAQDLMWDWFAFDLPQPACRLVSATMLVRGEDGLHTSEEEKLESNQKIKELVSNYEVEMEKTMTERWKVDMNSDSWLSKNIRPMVLIFLVVSTVLMIFIDAGVLTFEVKDTWVDLLQLVLITVIGAYFGGRSLEKVKK